MIRIKSQRNGYIRCGHRHPRQADYEEGFFTDEEINRFKTDPVLEVIYTPTPVLPSQPGANESNSIDETMLAMRAEDPDKENEDWWTQEGAPEVAELRRRGFDLSADERNAAWDVLLKSVESDDAKQPPISSVEDAMHFMLASDPEKENDDWWTQAGKPEVKALREHGFEVSADERDEWWHRLLDVLQGANEA